MPKTTLKTATVKDIRSEIYNLTVPGDLNKRLTRYIKEKGFDTAQQTIRVALTDFLSKQGF